MFLDYTYLIDNYSQETFIKIISSIIISKHSKLVLNESLKPVELFPSFRNVRFFMFNLFNVTKLSFE